MDVGDRRGERPQRVPKEEGRQESEEQSEGCRRFGPESPFRDLKSSEAAKGGFRFSVGSKDLRRVGKRLQFP